MSFLGVGGVLVGLTLDVEGLPHGHHHDAKHDGAEEPVHLGTDLAATDEDEPADGHTACETGGVPGTEHLQHHEPEHEEQAESSVNGWEESLVAENAGSAAPAVLAALRHRRGLGGRRSKPSRGSTSQKPRRRESTGVAGRRRRPSMSCERTFEFR